MIYTSNCHLPRSLDREVSVPLRGEYLSPGAEVIAVGNGARWLAKRKEEELANLSAVVLVDPDYGPLGETALLPWARMAESAGRGEILFAVWCTYRAPLKPKRWHPYDGTRTLARLAEAFGGKDLVIDSNALIAWPEGEILSAGEETHDRFPRCNVKVSGGFVALTDLESPSVALGKEIGVERLVEGALLPWRSSNPAPRRTHLGKGKEGNAYDELDGVVLGAERVGEAIVRGTRAATRVKKALGKFLKAF